MASSDFSSTYMLGVRLVAFPSRPGTRVRAWMRPPRFRAKNFPTCTRSPTARGSSHASHSPWDDVAFSSTERDRHLGIRPVSQLNTWPVVSPVNASRRPSRDAAHHSGSGRLARPSPWGTFTSYSLPASWRTPNRVKTGLGGPETPLLVLPEQRTSFDRPGWSVQCQQRSSRLVDVRLRRCVPRSADVLQRDAGLGRATPASRWSDTAVPGRPARRIALFKIEQFWDQFKMDNLPLF